MIVAIYPVKGGTGKTTLALALAGAAAMRGMRVLLVDLDQATPRASQSLLEGSRAPLGEVVAGLGPWYGVRVTAWDGESQVPFAGADLTIIDCPADPGKARPAAEVADIVLLPVPPEPFAAIGLADAHAALPEQARDRARMVISMADQRERLHRDGEAEIRSALGERVVEPVVPRRAAVPRVQAEGAPMQLSQDRGLGDVLPAVEALLDSIMGGK